MLMVLEEYSPKLFWLDKMLNLACCNASRRFQHAHVNVVTDNSLTYLSRNCKMYAKGRFLHVHMQCRGLKEARKCLVGYLKCYNWSQPWCGGQLALRDEHVDELAVKIPKLQRWAQPTRKILKNVVKYSTFHHQGDGRNCAWQHH